MAGGAGERRIGGRGIEAAPPGGDVLVGADQVEAARALVYAAAKTIDSGSKDFTQESAMSKVFASDTAMKVTTDAMQIFGGVGYMRDYPIEKMFRDAKITQIYEGANQVLRNAIAFELRKKKGMGG